MGNYSLTAETIKKLNRAYTKKVREAFKPLMKSNAVYSNKINAIVPSKLEIIVSVASEFNLPLTLVRNILAGNRAHLACKDKIVAKRDAFFIKKHQQGKSVAELSQHYGFSKQFIDAALQEKPMPRRNETSSFLRVIDEFGLRTIRKHKKSKEGEDETTKPRKKRRKKTKVSYRFEDTIANLGHADYLKLKLNKKK